MSEPTCEGHPRECYERRRCACSDGRDRVRWFLWLCALAGALAFAAVKVL